MSTTRIARFLRNLLRRDRVERDLDAELRAYVELAAEEHRGKGLTDQAARRAALLELGGFDQVKESVRDARAGALVDEIRQDLAYALRMLRRNAGFSAVAILTLALGIGANTAIFTLVDTVVFRPLPYAEPSRLVKICGNELARLVDDFTVPDFIDLRDRSRLLQQIAADDGTEFAITHRDGSRESVMGGFVTANWLTTLGVQPILGRAFLAEEDQPGRDGVVILTHEYWRRRFSADASVIATTLTIDGKPHSVVGVLPPNVFRYGADFLKPLVLADQPADRKAGSLDVFARLQPGVTPAQAQAEIDTIAARLAEAYPATNAERRFRLVPLDKYYASIDERSGWGLLLMLGAVGLVLLIACANVTNLLLARTLARQKECVVRAAMGANRARLVRQMLIEGALLFLIGGAAGVILAGMTLDSLRALAVAGNYVPERMIVELDTRVFLFTLLVSLAASLVFGLGPALQASRVDLNHGLRASSPTLGGAARRHRHASRLVIVAELAVSVVLLVGFGLLIRSFLRLQAESAGINMEHLLATASDGGRVFPTAVTYWQDVLEHTRRVPGVESAAVTSRPPVHNARRQGFIVEGQTSATDGENQRAGDILVSADYFRTMGIPLVKGRGLTERDQATAPLVAVISESLARRYFPNQDPLGRHLSVIETLPNTCCSAAGPLAGVWREIVGVVRDVRQANLDEEPAETIYRPFTQIVEHDMFVMVRARSASDAARLTATLGPQLRALKPAAWWDEVRSMEEIVNASQSVRLRRFVLILLGSFALLAVVLAGIGTYGVIAYSVAERTREIGIRVALGASRPAVFREVLSESTALVLGGLTIGALSALALSRLLAGLLFGVSATDTATYVSVSGILAAVALLASYVPARRATRVDPMVALRHE